MPKTRKLRQLLLKETHDLTWAGHPGQERTFALLSSNYFWPPIEQDVEFYVKTCLVCQHDKMERRKEASLLQPLKIPMQPWESISMHFINGFPWNGLRRSWWLSIDSQSMLQLWLHRTKGVYSRGGYEAIYEEHCEDVGASLQYNQ